jgi:hypothetical protein
MIVELCGTDLLELVNGRQVAVEDVIVRTTESDVSTVRGDRSTVSVPLANKRAGCTRSTRTVAALRLARTRGRRAT